MLFRSATYGVPPAVVVAVWGIESNFGQFTGVRPTVQALATLAFDGRRALFRNELFDALRIVDQGHITLAELKGSWAGAMGQPQFMPSSYLQLAVDQDGDGRADLTSSGRHELRIFLQRRDGSFGRQPDRRFRLGRVSLEDHMRGSGAVRALARDIDGDGRTDLLTLRSADRSMRVLLGDGAGNFAPTANLPVGGAALTVADFNSDGAKIGRAHV